MEPTKAAAWHERFRPLRGLLLALGLGTKWRRRVWHERFWFRLGLLPAVVTLLSFGAARLGVLERFESVTYDLRMASRPAVPMLAPAVFCAIDDEALRQYGRWPWPRGRLAHVTRLVSNAGARAVLLDIEFPERSAIVLEGAAGSETGRQIQDRFRSFSEALARVTSGPALPATTSRLEAALSGARDQFWLGLQPALARLSGGLDEDALLAGALRSSRRVHGVAHLLVGATAQDRALALVREQLAAEVARNPALKLSELPAAIAEFPRAQLLLDEARLRRELEGAFESNSETVARKLGLEFAGVDRSLESIRTAVLRKAIDRSVREHPDEPSASHRARVVQALSIRQPEAYESQFASLLEAAMGAREVLSRWSQPAEKFSPPLQPLTAPGMSVPIMPLVTAFQTVSFSNTMPDSDGVQRRVPLLWKVEGRLMRHPSLTLAIELLGGNPASLSPGPGPSLGFSDSTGRSWTVPVDERGQMIVNWTGTWDAFPSFSISGVLDAASLETAYLEALRALDRSGMADALASRIAAGEPWSVGPPAEYEAELLSTAQQAVERLEELVRQKAGDTGPGDEQKQRKRKEQLETRRSVLARARYLRGELTHRLQQLEGFVRNKVCCVGATASALTDFIVTPCQANFPGVGLHADALGTILSQRFISRLRPPAELLLIAALALLSGILFTRSSLHAGLFLGVALLGADWVVSAALLTSHGLWVPVVGPWMVICLNCCALLTLRYFTEVRQKNEVEKMFGYYLSPEVIQQLRDDPSKLRRGGEETEITALFTDLAGFSTVSEQMSPTEVVALLNEYLGDCTEVMMKHHGTLERYEGDAIRCMFGAPIHHPDHAARACLAALEMQRVVLGLREKNRAAGRTEFKMRLGLNTGRAVVGNIGARNRFNFTMQGDSVNLAARLEGTNKTYGTSMCLGETTFRQAGHDFEVRELDIVRVAGRSYALHIYELLSRRGELDPTTARIRELFLEGLEAYRARRWKVALAHFENAGQQGRADPPSEVYIKRCQAFLDTPPPDDWDGVTDVKK